MFWLKIIVMGIFTEIYSFTLNVGQDTNVIWTQNVVQDNLSSNFYREQID